MPAYTVVQLVADLKLRFMLKSDYRDDLLLNLINDVVERVWAKHDWNFYFKPTRLVTVTPYDTGTISVTADSDAVVGTGTTWTSDHVGAFIDIEGSQDSYTIKEVTDATNIVLDTIFTDTTDASATYTIRQARVAVPADFGSIQALSLTQVRYYKLDTITPLEWSHDTSGDSYSGTPVSYCVFDFDGNTYIHLYPIPSNQEGMTVLYKRRPTMLTTIASGNLDIPQTYQMNELIRYGVIEMYHTYEKDTSLANLARRNYERFLLEAQEDDRKVDEYPLKKAIGSRRSGILHRDVDSSMFL